MRSFGLPLVFWAMANHGGLLAIETTKVELSERIFSQFAAPGDEFTLVYGVPEFERGVPPERRLAGLVAIWDHPYPDPKDSLRARGGVAWYLSRHPELKWDTYPPLCLRIHSMLFSPVAGVRNGWWEWLAQEKGPQYVRPFLIAGLSEPDEMVRDNAVRWLVRLGDALPLLEEYVRQNQDDPRWEHTVRRAKGALRNAREDKDAGKKP